MDPEATLELLVNAINKALAEPSKDRQLDHFRDAQDALEDLEDWCQRGGFAPAKRLRASK